MHKNDKRGVPTGELGPPLPRPEGTPPNRPDEGSLSLSRFLGWGQRAIGRQDRIFGGNNMVGALVILAFLGGRGVLALTGNLEFLRW
jgi:hypothetical protein